MEKETILKNALESTPEAFKGSAQTSQKTELKELTLAEREANLWKEIFYQILCRKCQFMLLEVKSKSGSTFEEIEQAIANHKQNYCQDKKEPKIQWTEGTVRILDEKKESNLTKITGIITSSLRPKPSSNTPYYGYLRTREDKHSLEECANINCKDCEIPIVFRCISKNHRMHEMEPKEPCFNEKEHWKNPNLKKGDKVELTGRFENSKKSSRPSFTCFSYQIINNKDHE